MAVVTIMLLYSIFTSSLSMPLSASLDNESTASLEGSVVFRKNNNPQLSNKQLEVAPIYPDFKQYGRQTASLDKEYWLSQKDSAYSKTQLVAARHLDITPVVDSISEDHKYGNDGTKHANIARALVNGFEALGNIVNSIVDKPFQTKDHVARITNAALDSVGAKLVGL